MHPSGFLSQPPLHLPRVLGRRLAAGSGIRHHPDRLATRHLRDEELVGPPQEPWHFKTSQIWCGIPLPPSGCHNGPPAVRMERTFTYHGVGGAPGSRTVDWAPYFGGDGGVY